MPKLKIASFANSATGYVTFSADAAVSFYRVFGYMFGKTGTTVAAAFLSFGNVPVDDGTTATIYIGAGPASLGASVQFPRDGIVLDARSAAFVTVTFAAAQTGTLAIPYEITAK